MAAHMQNPGVQAGASRDLLCLGWSQTPITALDLRAQLLASRFGLSPWLAQDYAQLCFGRGFND